MASRFQGRDNARNNLFSGYDARKSASRPISTSPAPGSTGGRPSYSYAYNNNNNNPSNPTTSPANTFSAYGNGPAAQYDSGSRPGSGYGNRGSFEQQQASKQAYGPAHLDALESQNDSQGSELLSKVTMLKDITMKIGDEIRGSTHLAEKMNDQFGNTGVRLKGTMNRMLRMAERTGVGWRVWLGFFAFVIFIFCYVWLFR